MSRNTIKLVQGDTLPEIIVKITDDSIDDNGNEVTTTVDLTDVASAVMKIRKRGSLVLTDTIAGMVLPPSSSGRLLFAFSTLSLANEGQFEAEIELTMLGGSVFTLYDPVRIHVRPQF